ncbi:Avl9 protein [Maudiozyma humilis]|uniref:Avl9 protein n=1 Tax=Maudiozyma humilis TaxID=51915 RepID=A0AAV5RY36_MAUHU|nr:Avl9 protein [Kazachstania humilis]
MTTERGNSAIFGVCLVDFHHKRGPEIEYWHGLPESTKQEGLWANLPFQALPDGSHSFEETFTYFTLLYDNVNNCSPVNGASDLSQEEAQNYTTLFAISCSRQIKTEDLITKDSDVTRSTVQKAIVVVSTEPIFGQIHDKLSIVTNAYFLQHDFTDKSILISLYDNLRNLYTSSSIETTVDSENRLYIGLCLRKVMHDFKKDVLVLLKAMLLEKRIIFYGSNVEYLCNLQFTLVSLIPSLLLNLRDCGSPLLFKDVSQLKGVTSFKSSDRKSVLRFLGLPLEIFQKGGLFSPYTPLQQVDDIKSVNTKFFVIGSSNSLLYERKAELCDIFVNVDDVTVEIIEKTLQPALQLTGHDKKWIESIVAIVEETWNENDDETPKNSQFKGSEDFIRWQFEDYLTGCLSSAKLYDYITIHKDNQMALQSIPSEYMQHTPWNLFNSTWVDMWKESQNYAIFNKVTDDRLFDLFTPKHAYNGVDNFAIFQQKLVATFQNLRRNPSINSGSNISKNESQDASATENDEKSTIHSNKTEETSAKEKTPTKGENVWASWKEYFNKRKGKKDEGVENGSEKSAANEQVADDELKEEVKENTEKVKGNSKEKGTTNNNLQQNSTRKAIENALLGLGLHLDHKTHDKEKIDNTTDEDGTDDENDEDEDDHDENEDDHDENGHLISVTGTVEEDESKKDVESVVDKDVSDKDTSAVNDEPTKEDINPLKSKLSEGKQETELLPQASMHSSDEIDDQKSTPISANDAPDGTIKVDEAISPNLENEDDNTDSVVDIDDIITNDSDDNEDEDA